VKTKGKSVIRRGEREANEEGTEMTTPKQILERAFNRLTPANAWGKGARVRNRPLETCCLAEAIEEAAPGEYAERRSAVRAVYHAAGLDYAKDALVHWNDAPERTHADVLRALKLAMNFVP
jgi:transposase